MKVITLTINIESLQTSKIECLVSDRTKQLRLIFSTDTETLSFDDNNYLADVVRNNRFQFNKVMRSAVKGNISPGQTIHCVFLEGFNFLDNSDYSRFIVMDRRDGKLEISASETEMGAAHKIYADGSFAGNTKQSGYGGFIEYPGGNREIFSESFDDGNSNLMELLAVSQGLQRLKHADRIQVNTDSRFVIRGLVQWVHFWKHNNWQTAYDSTVKFEKQWQTADQLCEGKIVEFRWIKGHSGHEAQDFCHQLAQQSAGLFNDDI